MNLQPVHPWQQAQPILEALSSLSYRTGELDRYLHEIACSVSHLLELDWSDKDKLKQVSIDLIRSACEAIDPGEVVTCQLEIDNNSDRVCLDVRNGGTPIPAELLPKLTQPFCSGKPGGTGLGLAIVKRIVDAHGGILSIQSNLLTGTKVEILLPLAKNRKTMNES